jgi:hypothetical protein
MAAHRQLKLEPVAVSTPEEFERRLATIAQLHPDAMYVYPDPLTARFAKATIDFAAKHRLPAVYGFRQARRGRIDVLRIESPRSGVSGRPGFAPLRILS